MAIVPSLGTCALVKDLIAEPRSPTKGA